MEALASSASGQAFARPSLFGVIVPLVIFGAFFAELIVRVSQHSVIFTRRFARRHRLVGLVYSLWLLVGFLDVYFRFLQGYVLLVYDVTLGLLGVSLALTAAYDFKAAHEKVKNVASGALEQEATVTFSEMIEHSFYEGLNLVQIMFLHASSLLSMPTGFRIVLLFVATSPWLFRGRFPYNSFSQNYVKNDPWTITSIMYRMKKYQYLLYKHFLLHGLNISVAITPTHRSLATTNYFRLYWMGLNCAYTMEFFLQSLVKKGHLPQRTMLRLNQMTMVACTVAALQVLQNVYILTALLSLFLNLVHRKHEMLNTLAVTVLSAACIQYGSQ